MATFRTICELSMGVRGKIRRTVMIALGGALTTLGASGQSLPTFFPFPNETGVLETFKSGGMPIGLTDPSFQPLGSKWP
jgi:hypothetical protein